MKRETPPIFAQAAGAPLVPFARWWMRLLVAMGAAGVGFHAYGISIHRNLVSSDQARRLSSILRGILR